MQKWYVDQDGVSMGSTVDAVEDPPEDWIEVPYGPPLHADQVWQFPEGPYGRSMFVESTQENAWREAALAAVPDEIAKVEDDDPAAVGTVEAWRAYRKALRLWVDGNPAFPFGTRPAKPQ